MTCLERQRQSRSNRYTDQQLEREVGHSTVDDLAQSRLGEAQLLCGYDLSDAHTMRVTRKLQGDITAQRLNGSDIGRRHSHIVNLL
jgi:hypothetical protein